jgi:hypothetical protein
MNLGTFVRRTDEWIHVKQYKEKLKVRKLNKLCGLLRVKCCRCFTLSNGSVTKLF